MRVIIHIATLLISFLLIFASCEMKKELTGGLKPNEPDETPIDPTVNGALDLHLNVHPETDTPETKAKAEVAASVNEEDFEIQIIDSAGTVVQHFDSYRDYLDTDKLLLKEGVYTIRASWGKLYDAAFDAPYFSGDTTCKIEPGVVSTIKTDCSLQNAKVNIRYTDEFMKVFKDDYSAVVTNGTGILTLDKDEQRVAYFRSNENIKLIINATTHKGMDISTKRELTDISPNALYDIVLGIDVSVDSVIDQLVKPGIIVDVAMHDRDTIINIEPPVLPPDPDDGPDEPNVPDVPGGDGISVVGSGIDSPVEMTDAEAQESAVPVRVTIKASAGLAKVVVKITAPAVEAILQEENPFDLVSPSEVMGGILTGVGLTLPSAGDMEYTLDVTGFMKMLGGPGNYKFDVTVTDKENKSLAKTLTVIIK